MPERVLDQEVEATRAVPGAWLRFGLLQVLLPPLLLISVVVAALALGLPRGDSAAGLYTLLAEGVAGLVIWQLGRGLAQQYGGWRRAFGLDLPRSSDVGTVVGWCVLQFVARLALIMALPEGWTDAHGGNTEGVSDLPVVGLIALGLASVIAAPLIEELGFRGVILRGLMRRFAFWPAALLSSALFGGLHAMGAAELAGIPLLVAATTLFGLLQCLLVRRTGRLGPAIGVHALTNLLVLVLAVSSGA